MVVVGVGGGGWGRLEGGGEWTEVGKTIKYILIMYNKALSHITHSIILLYYTRLIASLN